MSEQKASDGSELVTVRWGEHRRITSPKDTKDDRPFWERPVAYHGEPADEVNAAIWKVAAERSPDPLQQSAFNDGAHYVIQHLRDACAEVVRLHGMLDATGAFTDKAAFGKFNADYTLAHRVARAALTAVLGEPSMEALHFQADEAYATMAYGDDNT